MLPHFSATLNFPSFVLCRIRSFPDRGTGAPGKRSFRVPPHDNTHHQRKGAGLIVFVCAPAGACRLRTAPAPCCARTHANCLAPTVAWTSPPPFPPPPTAPQPDARMAGTQSPLCVCVCVLGAGAREGAEGPPGSCSAAAPLPHGSCRPPRFDQTCIYVARCIMPSLYLQRAATLNSPYHTHRPSLDPSPKHTHTHKHSRKHECRVAAGRHAADQGRRDLDRERSPRRKARRALLLRALVRRCANERVRGGGGTGGMEGRACCAGEGRWATAHKQASDLCSCRPAFMLGHLPCVRFVRAPCPLPPDHRPQMSVAGLTRLTSVCVAVWEPLPKGRD